jgi:ADP-heptose:LPS heptosyltransferase
MLQLAFSSIFVPRIYVNVLPIVTPTYYKLFAYFIRFCTRSRFVGFNLEGSRNFPIGKGSSFFLGKENYITAEIDTNLFQEEANRMLTFLGYSINNRPPEIKYVQDLAVLEKFSLTKGNYTVIHMAASHADRSFSPDKWNRIIARLRKELPTVPFVFTGSESDGNFIEKCLENIPKQYMVLAYGKATTQQLLTLHANAKLNVTVHTGNAHFINMLHVPTLTLNIKGVYFFKFFYNEHGEELVSTKDCTCDPYERECTMIPYKGQEYMACLYNIDEADVISKVLSMYTTTYVK